MLRIEKLEWKGMYKLGPVKIISFIWDKKVSWGECLTFLAHLQDVSAESLSIKSVLLVSYFQEVFPTDLFGMPSNSYIDFCNDKYLCTHTISIPSYGMDPAELRDLKTQLKELLNKGPICPSISP